jgi:RNA polymerase sigma-70 factor (ECF subfamily)
MFEGMDDIRLMGLVKGGDMDAFSEIIRRHQSHLVNFFQRMNAHIDEAEACAQETFVRLYDYRGRYSARGSKFTTFLFTLARHVWADECRRTRRSKETVSLDDAAPIGGKAAAGDADRAGVRMDVEAALARLPEKLREAVVLSVCEGMDYQEISEILEIPLGTVKSRMFVAFTQMRKDLGHGG